MGVTSGYVFLNHTLERTVSLIQESADEFTMMLDKFDSLASDLDRLRELLQVEYYDLVINKKAILIANNLQNAIERWALLRQDGVPPCSRKTGLDLVEHDFMNIKKMVDEIKPFPTQEMIRQVLSIVADNIDADDELLEIPEADDIVGIDEDMDILRPMLLNHSDGNTRIAIVGMSGVGKTLLGLMMINDPEVKRSFDFHACVYSGSSDVVCGLRSILDQFHIEGHDHDHITENELLTELREIMSSNRCLVLLDNVWFNWRNALQELPGDKSLSKIIVTTRDEILARGLCGINTFKVRFRTSEESKDLLMRKSQQFDAHSSGGKHLKLELVITTMTNNLSFSLIHIALCLLLLADIYKNASFPSTITTIMSLCRGLPSEIIRVANILKGKKLEDWDEIVGDMLRTNEIEETGLMKSIALSYDDLSPEQKLCFLYMGLFPLDQPIPTEKVFFMWMAQGLVDSLEDAQWCLRVLEKINLVMVNIRGVVSTRQLQVMTHKLCRLYGKQEEFSEIVDCKHESTIDSITSISAAIYLNAQVKGNDISSYIHLRVAKHIRSLLFFGNKDSGSLVSHWSGNFSELENFESTRVLNFDGIDFRANKHSIGEGKLVHLRYLGFEQCYLEEFPLTFCNFPYLEILNLQVGTKMIIPNVLWKMSNLKHLYFPSVYECKTREKLRLDGLKKLELLENFHAGVCNVDDLLQLECLKILNAISDGENVGLRKLIKNVGCSLEWSSLNLKDFDCYSKDRKDTIRELLECNGIYVLHIEGCIKRMPNDLVIAQNFTDIVLDGTEFREDPMPIVGKIANLKSLVLRNDAITIQEISCPGKSFPCLESLEINNLRSLKSWLLEEESMPCLVVLTIKQCHKLVMLPENLMARKGMIPLEIQSMPNEFMKRYGRGTMIWETTYVL